MPLDPLSIIGIAASGAKAIGGLIGGIGGKRQQDRLWQSRPRLGVTDGERANSALYSQLASATSLPGEQNYLDKMNETVASGIYDAQRTANSSLGATQAAVDLNSRKLSAIQDLAGAFSEFKVRNKERLGQWNTQKIGLEQERFMQNEMLPWEIKMNETISRKKAGMEMLGSGVDSGLGIVGDLAGTKQMMDVYQQLYGKQQ